MEQQEVQPDKPKYKTLIIEDVKYKTQYNKKFENRKIWKAADPTKICSYIPGSILKVFVKPGQKVKKGTDLLLLDAMKMSNTIRAHADGTIQAVFVKPGDKVPKGFIMIELV